MGDTLRDYGLSKLARKRKQSLDHLLNVIGKRQDEGMKNKAQGKVTL